MRQIPPLVFRERYYKGIEAEIQRLFDNLIYKPILSIVLGTAPDEIMNSMRALVKAIADGTIWYQDGQFKGQFTSGTSKELKLLGARWNPAARTFSLTREDLPADVQIAQATADSRYDAIRRDVIETLDTIDLQVIDTRSDTVSKYGQVLDQMEMDFRKSVSGIDAVTIDIKFTPAQRKIIAEQWGQNLDLYIKGWAAPNILKLREQVQANMQAGGRSEALVKIIKDNYQVSKAKAKFLARQETSLLMSKFRETRYADAGVRKYRWSTSHDERVRHDHAVLDGKVFQFSAPPVTNRRTAARNNPGEDFNCRCVAVGLID